MPQKLSQMPRSLEKGLEKAAEHPASLGLVVEVVPLPAITSLRPLPGQMAAPFGHLTA